MKAFIREVFSSVQGEGPYIGRRQIFIRLGGCNLSCRYCDTEKSVDERPCRVEAVPGKRVFSEVQNPVRARDLVSLVRERYPVDIHHSFSITGGEPLLQVDFLTDLLPALKNTGLPVFLETNGTLPEGLARVIGLVDIVSMDIKLPGTAGCPPLWDEHLRFLSIARKAEVFVKIVADDLSDILECKRAADLVAGVDSGVTFIIQPRTEAGRCMLSPGRALYLQALALERLKDVRIIPQAHVMMGQL
ncbi:MAG: 7-carboxy-7-deazaguanine synthase QueE [Bacillota bacterium]